MLVLFLFSLASIWNQPVVGAVTESTAVVLVGLDTVPDAQWDSSVTEYGLTTAYGSVSDTAVGRWNRMNLNGLQPDTIYHYNTIVFRGADSVESGDRCFKTQDTSGTFTFVYIGDPQPDLDGAHEPPYYYEPVTDSLIDQIRKEHADFVLSNGDQTDIRGYFQGSYGNIKLTTADTCWHVLHDTYLDTMLDSTMLCFAIGNHETFTTYGDDDSYQWIIDTIIEAYNNAVVSYPTGNDSGYYYYVWGDCIFIILNTNWLYVSPVRNRLGETQMAWVTDVLMDTIPKYNFKWSFIFFHHPFFGGHDITGYWYMGTNTERDSLNKMMKLAGIDVQGSGHHHLFDMVDAQNYTRAFVSGGGGGAFGAYPDFPYDLNENHYILFKVYPDSIRGYLKGAAGDTLYTFLMLHESKASGSAVLGGVKF